jgi:hypothetical protein
VYGDGRNEPSGPGRDHEIERRFREISAEIAREDRTFGDKGNEKLDRAGERQARKQSKKTRKARRGRGPRGWTRSLGTGLIVVAVLAVIGGISWLQLGRGHNAADDTKPVTNGAVPTVRTPASPVVSSTLAGPTGPPADPFTGSPADAYADGAAGITIPAAAGHGPFSAAQVQAAYTEVRKLLIAADLDPTTLRGGAPAAFAGLLTSQQRSFFTASLDKTGRNPDYTQRSTRTWVESFAPGTTNFIGSVIKVHGTMSAGLAEDNGRQVLRVQLDYLFVYPVEPPGLPADWTRLVARNYGDVDFATWDDPGGALEPWLRNWNDGGTAGNRCDVADGFIHPQYPAGPGSKVKPSGTPIDPYNQSVPPSSMHGCQAATRT